MLFRSVHMDDRYDIEEKYGIDVLDAVNSELTDAYFDKYYDELYELVERFSKFLNKEED